MNKDWTQKTRFYIQHITGRWRISKSFVRDHVVYTLWERSEYQAGNKKYTEWVAREYGGNVDEHIRTVQEKAGEVCAAGKEAP